MAGENGKGAPPLQKAIVAKGRSVVDGFGRHQGPGAEVSMPADEVKRLQGLGFLVDPSAPVLKTGNGPTFGTSAGPTVQQVA